MSKRFMQLVSAALAVALCIPMAGAARTNNEDEVMIRVGLASTSKHNALGVLDAAHLQNNTGYGAGYRFGYYDDDLNFVELGYTDEDVTEVAVLKTQNMYYGYVPSKDKYTYSDSIESDIQVGCFHIEIPGVYDTYDEALEDAAYYDGFVAWIDDEYRVRVGAYLSKKDAEAALEELEDGTIVGTTSYGMNVVETGTDRILFQYDSTERPALGILPDVTGEDDVRTWFSGFKYRGGFTYQRISGGGMTVANVLPLEEYVKGVVCYEMGRDWPLEALKAQAICARTYALRRVNYHNDLGFDVCNSDWCQVYRGVGSGREDYGPSKTSDQAVDESAGQVLWYKDNLAETYYSSCHGGASESAYYIWGTSMKQYPYLCGVEDPYEAEVADLNPYSSWTVKYTASQLTKRLQSFGYGTNTSVDGLELTYSELGNVIQVKVHYKNGQSNTISPRTSPGLISVFGLYSIRFTVNGETVRTEQVSKPSGSKNSYAVNEDDKLDGLKGLYVISGTGEVTGAAGAGELYIISGSGKTSKLEREQEEEISSGTNNGGGTVMVSGSNYVFEGSGWGHQIGLSQYGANAMARLGFDGEEIAEFYFPGTYVDSYE